MSLAYLSIKETSSSPIEYKDPLEGTSKLFMIEDCIDYLLNKQKNISLNTASDNLDNKIQHWLERKWQVSLDYYLLSTKSANPNPAARPISSSNLKPNILLPPNTLKPQLDPLNALLKRKTYRKFKDIPLQRVVLSQLLSALKNEIFANIWCYYLLIFNVEGIPAGIYQYIPKSHGLLLIQEGLFRKKAVNLLCGMTASLSASFVTILSIDLEQAQKNYPNNRTLRDIYIESGMLVQKMLIKGMQHYVGGLPSPAMRDTPMSILLQLDINKQIPLYTLTMGPIPAAAL